MRPNKQRAYAKALAWLARRECSRFELQQRMQQARFDKHCIDEVLSQLADEGAQSDWRYACALVHSRATKGYGPVYARGYLLRRGVAEALITEALAQLSSQEWQECLQRAWLKKYSQRPQNAEARAQQSRFLYQRGFTLGMIDDFLRQAE